jgi:NAD(P)-dependent dehydrogenase (short-subunit alcohol dehydrogenase family)
VPASVDALAARLRTGRPYAFKDLDHLGVLRRAKVLVPGQGGTDAVSLAGRRFPGRNHVAVAALTEGLLDLLRKGADDFASPSRVVNMTALIESRGNPITDWSYPGKYSQMHAYADAKLLALMYTYAKARRHQGDGLTFNAVSPGTVNSGFGGKAGGTFKTIQALMKPFVGPPEKGSRGCVRLLADPGLATAAGGYYSSAELKSHPRSLVTMTPRTGCTSRPNANCVSTTEAAPAGYRQHSRVRQRSRLH